VQDDLDEARRLGINSTPTFVINGRVARGALTLEEFKAAIDKELQSAKRTNP
jgi:protein-disulfide isomerase